MGKASLDTIAKHLALRSGSDIVVDDYSIDSRLVQKGDLFFALTGKKVDGHDFLKGAMQKGAAAAVVREEYAGKDFGLPLLRVPDVTLALQEIGRKTLASRRSKVIAVSGSMGKTTAKEFIFELLRRSYKVFRSPLSYNSQVTLPLSILKADGDEDFLVLEMGMSERGDLEKLIAIAPPHIAVVTTVTNQHTKNFDKGLLGIANEKADLFTHPSTQLGIFHYDAPHQEVLAQKGSCPKVSFSLETPSADYFLAPFFHEGRAILRTPCGEEITFSLKLPLRPHYQNFLAASIAARFAGISWEEIREIAPTLTLPPMRFERVEKRGIVFINDAYNANPDAMCAALAHLPPTAGKTIAVLSEMDALGEGSEGKHAQVGHVALAHVDHLLCLGERCSEMQRVWQEAKRDVQLFHSKKELAAALFALVKQGDVVLLKGARSYALNEILDAF